ncbi:MAG: four helix bundle protein [Luteolibacter sp.]
MSYSLNELEIYREATCLGELVWHCVAKWDCLGKNLIGKQIIRSADSIAANIAEGHSRLYPKENLKFCYYSHSSLTETQTWLKYAARRKLIDEIQTRQLYSELETLRKRLNSYIKSIGPKSDTRDS